jgi:RPA family protein
VELNLNKFVSFQLILMETLRQTMIKSDISDLANGEFVRKEGFDPSYILTGLGKKISRTKVIGTVTGRFMNDEGTYSTITIEDDSAAIRVKAFGEETGIFDELEIGDIVTVIGKVKEYNDEIYISPEVVKKTDINFENLHKLEVMKSKIESKKSYDIVKSEMDKFTDVEEMKKYLTKKYKIDKSKVESIVEDMAKDQTKKEKDHKPFLLDLIDKLDEGKGVEIKKLVKNSKLDQNTFEEAMNELITEGLCYEPKPGFIKRV